MLGIFLLTVNLFSSWILPEHPNLTTAERADWVEVMEAEITPRHPSQVGTQFLLIDKQANSETNETYFHYVRRVLEGGLEDNSQIEIEFDPTYEFLTLHHVDIIRNGKKVSNPFTKEAKLLQREEDLANNIYQGHLDLHFLLHDIRKGDLVDVAYTLKGKNPTLDGHFYQFFDCSYPVQVEKLHFSCVHNKDRELYFKVHNADLLPEEQMIDGTLVSSSITMSPSWIDEDEETPSWYLAHPWVQVSSFETWDEVSAWGEELFRHHNTEIPREIENLLAIWSVTSKTKEELALQALTFVQEEIRYFGSFEGVYSLHPYSPNQTLSRRYGDCKDKTLLLKSFMDVIGIESTPCLVHTDFQQTIADFHPTPGAFNHVLLRLKLDDEEYFLDPTDKYQRGSLMECSQDVYGCYLPLDEGGLQTIEPKANVGAVDITHHFILDAQKDELHVSVHYLGAEANFYRSILAYFGEENLAENMRQKIVTHYGHADLTDFQVSDDEVNNSISVSHIFSLDSLLIIDDEYQVGSFNFAPLTLIGNLPDQVELSRDVPLAIPHPTNIHENIRISSSTPIIDNTESKEINHPAFAFKYAKLKDDDDLVITYSYETKSDHINPTDITQFRTDIEQIENLAYQAYYFPLAGSQSDTAGLIVGAIFLSIYALSLIITSYHMWKRLRERDRRDNRKQKWQKAFWIFYSFQAALVFISAIGVGAPVMIVLAIFCLLAFLWGWLVYKKSNKGGTVVLGIQCYLLAFTVPNPLGIYFVVRSVQFFRYNRSLKKGAGPPSKPDFSEPLPTTLT